MESKEVIDFNIRKLHEEAQRRWLKPPEVFFLLQNIGENQLSLKPSHMPESGSLFFYNKKQLKNFRQDGHAWRKKRDGSKAVAEAHERLKIGNANALNCYYAHGEDNWYFQRRSYWMLDSDRQHIVLVHYLNVSEDIFCWSLAQDPSLSSNNTSTNTARNYFCSSVYADINSDSSQQDCQTKDLLVRNYENISGLPFQLALRELTSQLSLEDLEESFTEKYPSESLSSKETEQEHIKSDNLLQELDHTYTISTASRTVDIQSSFSHLTGMEETSWTDTKDGASVDWNTQRTLGGVSHCARQAENNFISFTCDESSAKNGTFCGSLTPYPCLSSSITSTDTAKNYFNCSSINSDSSQQNCHTGDLHVRDFENIDGLALPLAFRKLAAQLSLEDSEEGLSGKYPSESLSSKEAEQEHIKSNNRLQELEHSYNPITASGSVDIQSSFSDLTNIEEMSWKDIRDGALVDWNTQRTHGGDSHCTRQAENNFIRRIFTGAAFSAKNAMLSSSIEAQYCGQYFMTSGGNAITPDSNKFFIREISPDWAYSTEITKVIITGDFLHVPENPCGVMFGEIEVPAEIIQQGVLRCWAPQHLPGRVKLCITAGNRESCSEYKEFSYLVHPDKPRNSVEIFLLVMFVRTILHESVSRESEDANFGHQTMQKTGANRLDEIMQTVLQGTEDASMIANQLLEELMKDKFSRWLEKRKYDGLVTGSSSKQDFCIIHLLSGLGYEWALNLVLDAGFGINFRDFDGRTALHWAARFGREKMAAALLAAGASAEAVTDPTQYDPLGKTPASVAAEFGYRGLSAYLSEAALTSHLSALKIGESEVSRTCAMEETNCAVETIFDKFPITGFASTEEQNSLMDSLGAVRNAAQAAARIQAAFRSHSFRKKQLSATYSHKYGTTPGQIHITMSKHHQTSPARHIAAVQIQKKFRGWKLRKTFLNMRQNAVKIQAHVRGYQVRRRYRFTMTVSTLEKAILRWRRKQVRLRGIHVKSESQLAKDCAEEEEEITKAFRKLKVDATLGEALSQVHALIEFPEARQQYRRMLECFQQVKERFI